MTKSIKRNWNKRWGPPPILFSTNQFRNRWFWEVVPDGAWADKPCFIVGGGPSLKHFDWTKLKGHRTIGVNRAFERFDPTIIFSMDTRFFNWMINDKYATLVSDGSEAKAKFLTSTAYKVWLCTYTLELPKDIFLVPVVKNYFYGKRNFTFSMQEGIGHGDNSGYAALNLAVCLGANPIYLLGFDCQHENGKSHWHEGHIMKQESFRATRWIKFFNIAAETLAPTNFRVVNLNPNSALECFEKMRPGRILH